MFSTSLKKELLLLFLWQTIAMLDQMVGKVNPDFKVIGVRELDVLNEHPIMLWLWLCYSCSFPQHAGLMLILE